MILFTVGEVRVRNNNNNNVNGAHSNDQTTSRERTYTQAHQYTRTNDVLVVGKQTRETAIWHWYLRLLIDRAVACVRAWLPVFATIRVSCIVYGRLRMHTWRYPCSCIAIDPRIKPEPTIWWWIRSNVFVRQMDCDAFVLDSTCIWMDFDVFLFDFSRL